MRKNKSNYKIIEIPIEKFTFNKNIQLIIECLVNLTGKNKKFLNYSDCKKLKIPHHFVVK